MTMVGSKDEFIALMESAGYTVKWTDSYKYITYTCPNGMKVRDNKLHESKFLKESMQYEFAIRQQQSGTDQLGVQQAQSRVEVGASNNGHTSKGDDDDRYPTGMGMGKYKRFCTRIDALVRKNKCKIGLDFIVANRLQKTYNSQLTRDLIAHGDMEYPRGRGREPEKIDFLQRASDEMTINIKEWLEEYNRMLEEAKNKLPSMYLMATDHSIDGYEEFENRWNDYHQELEKFYELGILKRTEAVIGSGELQGAYSKKASFLITYLDAFEGTLEPLQKNYLKLKLFSDIFHKRNEITHKTLKFTPNGIEIYSDDKKIDIDCLSSGEKTILLCFID